MNFYKWLRESPVRSGSVGVSGVVIVVLISVCTSLFLTTLTLAVVLWLGVFAVLYALYLRDQRRSP